MAGERGSGERFGLVEPVATRLGDQTSGHSMATVSLPALIWMVDDTPEWHTVTACSIDPRIHDLEHFHSGQAALLAFQALARDEPQRLPDIILLDYYLGDERGDGLCRQLRELQPAGQRPVIVGFSSVTSCSERIVAAGGDCVLPKRQDAEGRNRALQRWLAERARDQEPGVDPD